VKLKRWLYLSHRWLGIGLCLLFAMWFFTGVVMMYVHFPQLTEEERLAALPALAPERVRVPVERVLALAPEGTSIRSLRLTSVLGRPAYLLHDEGGTLYGLFADDGEVFAGFDAADALLAARTYQQVLRDVGDEEPRYLGSVDMDQWSLSRNLNDHRPLHHVALADAAGTRLYISSLTGEVVRDTDTRERVWNWLGANLHWIYSLVLRRHGELWHQVVVVLSLLGLAALVTGAVIGVLRLRIRNPYRGSDVTPYRGMMKLHHLLGLGCLLFLATFMFSGLMSMNPWGVFTSQRPFSQVQKDYRGASQAQSALPDSAPADLRAALAQYPDTREIVWQWLAGEPHLVLVAAPYQRRVVLADGREPDAFVQRARARLETVMAGAEATSATLIERYDAYYYSHHQRWRPLPVLRVKFDDDEHTWFHIDPATGELLNGLTTRGRVQRWLYNGMHSLDFTFLIQRRPLWDVIVIALSVLGLVFSVTSVHIGIRRLRHDKRRRSR